MKMYESINVNKLIPGLPVIARLDGRCFSSWTKDLMRPFDKDFRALMAASTEHLVEEARADIGYTQSDEITLIWRNEDISFETVFMKGKYHKMLSLLSSMLTSYFMYHLKNMIPKKQYTMPQFDCRVWQVPTLGEACNILVWREEDAVRNSIQAVGQCFFSHKELHKKTLNDILDMLHNDKGMDWNAMLPEYKRGQYVFRRYLYGEFTEEEISALPEKHEARQNPDLQFTRSQIKRETLPRLTKILNRKEVLFHGEKPIING
jgi:tRNA(His) 5'-end guanylyltransferase